MNPPNDYSVRPPGAGREIRSVTPVSDHSRRGRAYRQGKKKKARRKVQPDQQPPAGQDEGDRPEDQDDGHTVDTLA